MKMYIAKFLLTSALVAGATSVAACSDDDSGVDANNGKAISDLDIGGDLTLGKAETKQMTATVKYADGTSSNVTTSSDLVWNIENTDVATISSDGVVTGVSVGATKIKATYQGRESASHALVVH